MSKTKEDVINLLTSVNDREAGPVIAFVSELPETDIRFKTPFKYPEPTFGYWRTQVQKQAEAPWPQESVSYSNLLQHWKGNGAYTAFRTSLIGQMHGGFQACWNEKCSELQRLELGVKACLQEESGKGAGAYIDGGRMLEKVFRVLQAEEGGKAYFFCDKQGTGMTRPDVAWCGINHDVVIPSADMYQHLGLVLEYKSTSTMATTNGVNSGVGQIISRAGQAQREQNRAEFLLPGAVLDNLTIKPVIVKTASDCKKRSLLTTECQLHLVSADIVVDTQNPEQVYTVDTQSAGFKELVHLCWVAESEKVMRAAANPSQLSCLEDGSCVAVAAGTSDGGEARTCFRVVRRLSAPTASGCAYAAVACQADASLPADGAAGPLLVLKVAAAPQLLRRAEHLHLPLEPWSQVSREIRALGILEGHGLESLPTMHAHGLLDLGSMASGRCLQGAHVVVTSLLGEALVARGQGGLLVLPAAEAEQMMWDILPALAVLQERGIQHCDVHPRNLGRRVVNGSSRFYLFDFGSAMTATELAAGVAVQQPCSLLFSAVEVLLGGAPGPLADVMSLIFSGLALTGVPLPWYGAASAGDTFACVGLKVDFMADPVGQVPAWAGLFSPQLQQLLKDVMHCALDGGNLSLVDRLARTSRGARQAVAEPPYGECEQATICWERIACN